jgi:glycosyltransferase involved in cell wall biosynthesis
LITVLKAFSKFKQWQKSSMQLLLYSDGSISDEKFLKSLVTYKYKNDIKLVNAISLKEIALITASAYTVIYPASANDFYEPVIGVMQSGVPLITSPVNTIVEIAGEAALYADPDNVDDMAKHMITVYKDENKKKKMIADGLQYVQQYNFDNAAQLLWQSIVQAMGK